MITYQKCTGLVCLFKEIQYRAQHNIPGNSYSRARAALLPALSSQISIVAAAADYSRGAFLSMVFVLGTFSLFFVPWQTAVALCRTGQRDTSVERDKIFVR